MLDPTLYRKFVQALVKVPGANNVERRDTLLLGLPQHIIDSLTRYHNDKTADFSVIITQLDGIGRLERTNERPLIIIAQNALMYVQGASLGKELQDIIQELEYHYEEDLEDTSSELPDIPEVLIFEGRDERVPYAFLEKALSVGKGVARLQIPRNFNGSWRTDKYGLGTGWLVAPRLLFTNRHVVAARFGGEPPASEQECRIQTSQAVAWFDYHTEGGERVEYRCVELVHSDRRLDYALVRLEPLSQLNDRQYLPIAQQRVPLSRRDRLNIVQYSGGGPLKYAIRNNFYIGYGDSTDFIRYITDTEAGSSGSPVLNDQWEIVAMHHAYREINPELYKGETVKYHNQGVVIHAILDYLPPSARQEIRAAQGW